jgi:hypothetical protein
MFFKILFRFCLFLSVFVCSHHFRFRF